MGNDYKTIIRILNIVIALYIIYRIVFSSESFGLNKDLVVIVGILVLFFIIFRIYYFIENRNRKR